MEVMVPDRVTRLTTRRTPAPVGATLRARVAAAWRALAGGDGPRARLAAAWPAPAAGDSLLARVTGSRPAPVIGGVLLALAAAGQALALAITHARSQPAVAHVGSRPTPVPTPGAVAVAEYALPLLALALLAVLPLLFFRPAAAALTIAAANTASLVWFGAVTVAGIAAQLIAGFLLGRQGDPRWLEARSSTAAQALAVALAVPFVVLVLTSHASVAAVLLAWGAPTAAAAGIAGRARRETRTRTAAGEALAEGLSEHTARGERARIARELHDVVAHHISMVAVQAETARLTTHGLPAAGAQRFTEIGDTARAGLTEMRRLLGVLRDDAEDAGATVADRHPQPGLPQLAELIDAAREATAGRSTRLIVSGRVTEFDPGVELAAYRIVQEALTNARRHAPGAAVDVELRYDAAALHLRIRDNGPGPALAGPLDGPGAPGGPSSSGGHGLLGMRERALAVGGSLRTGPAPGGGFCVEAYLPAKPEAS
jgi:signal transduction histidine kinase